MTMHITDDATGVTKIANPHHLAQGQGRQLLQFPNGKIWPVEDGGVTAMVKIPDSRDLDGDSFLDAIAEAVTGSPAGLTGITIIERGNDIFEVSAGLDIDGMDIESASDDIQCSNQGATGLQQAIDTHQLAAAFIDQFGLSDVETRHAVHNLENRFEGECIRPILGTMRDIHAPGHPEECSYVRIVVCGIEVAYWTSDEWRDDPELVMGALIGSLHGR